MSGALDLLWLVPALPFAGAAVNLAVGRRLGRRAGWLAVVVMAASFALSVGVALGLAALPTEERHHLSSLGDWFAVGSLRVGFDLLADPLSATMLLVVTGVGTLIHVYAIGYMEGDPRFSRFFAYLNLFVGFMLMLVLGENLLLLYLGWEGVGLCSYLLIGFWFERPSAAAAAKKAFITTRIGDALLMAGIVLVFLHLGSLSFGDILAPGVEEELSQGTFTVIALLLFGGAVGKSAQVPLHVWLPDAMEGPTPVSALIHAATMVTAGVYLVARTHVIFEASHVALTVVAIVGLITAIYAAAAAIGQDDIKRVLAYSTISQLGYMFLALGLEAYGAAIFMLVAHAFYKALMFLAAGSVMHGMHDETDMRRMGGLRRMMPITAGVFAVGAISIAGLPPTSGFYSKDPILAAAAHEGGTVMFALSLVAALLTALYIARLMFLTFVGARRSDVEAHESPTLMTAPLVALAALAAAGGWLGLTAEDGRIQRWLEPVLGIAEKHVGAPTHAQVVAFAVGVAAVGIAIGWWLFGARGRDPLAPARRAPRLFGFLAAGGHIDGLYARGLVAPATAFAGWVARAVDRGTIDRVVMGVGRVVGRTATVGRRVQTGFVRTYALAFLLGAVVLLAYVGSRF